MDVINEVKGDIHKLWGVVYEKREFNFNNYICNNSYYNFLNFEETTFLHKYGFTSPYYNELGIYNSTYPYLISLFTNLPSLEYQTFIPEFSKEVFSIYQSNLKEKEDYCNSVKNSV